MKDEKPLIISYEQNIQKIAEGIIDALLYFDIFSYPLTKDELQKYCYRKVHSSDEFNEILNLLVEKKQINFQKGFYFVNEDSSIIERRRKGNHLAEKYKSKAKRYSDIISKFPFVRAVFISGSLSKGYMDKESDIDYFIITTPGRLWLCRTLLILFKKIFLLNSHKYFCVNYFIDENNLEIPDKNIFTATELVTLIPMSNHALFEKFIAANNWTKDFLPNAYPVKNRIAENGKKIRLKFYLEKIFNSSFGQKLDDLCLQMTLRYWKRKFTHFSEEDFKNALRSKKNVSKHHPNKFQEKVLALYRQKTEQFEKSSVIPLSVLYATALILFQ